MYRKLRVLIIGIVGVAASLTGAGTAAHASAATFRPFTIISPDFSEDGWLPVSSEFGGPGSAGSGCSGKNQAPTLHWSNVPSGTKSFAFTITVYALSASHVAGPHLTYSQLMGQIGNDVVGATSTIGKFRLPLNG